MSMNEMGKLIPKYTEADLGAPPARACPPQQDPIPLFSHTFPPKSTHVRGRWPPTGNPGSATDTVSKRFNPFQMISLADLGGACRVHATPYGTQFFCFRIHFHQKVPMLEDHTPLTAARPPAGNPGSATGYGYKIQMC